MTEEELNRMEAGISAGLLTRTELALFAKSAIAEIRRLKQRESDLLEANNRYLQRARDAEDALNVARYSIQKFIDEAVSLANSGDAGNYDAEYQDDVIEGRKALVVIDKALRQNGGAE